MLSDLQVTPFNKLQQQTQTHKSAHSCLKESQTLKVDVTKNAKSYKERFRHPNIEQIVVASRIVNGEKPIVSR